MAIETDAPKSRQVLMHQNFPDWLANIQPLVTGPVQLIASIGDLFELELPGGGRQGEVTLFYEVLIGDVSYRIPAKYNYSKMALEGVIGRVECATTAAQFAVAVSNALEKTGGVDSVALHLANGRTSILDRETMTHFADRHSTPFRLRRVSS